MSRSLNTQEAKELIAKHRELKQKISSSVSLITATENEIREAADALQRTEALSVLSGVPVEEINRGSRSFRVKALKAAGITSMADLCRKEVYHLAAISGISRETAYGLKAAANEYLETAKSHGKIRLNADERTEESGELIRALVKYRIIRKEAGRCQALLHENDREITAAIEDAECSTSGIRWLFTSKEKKERAEKACELLLSLTESSYAQIARDAVLKIEKARALPVDEAWEEYVKDPVSCINILEDTVPGIIGEDSIYGLPQTLAEDVRAEEFCREGLHCELRKYQEWGVKYALHQGNILLGDEMGLGKTVQAIACMVALANNGATHFLVVCPASVLSNWVREIRKMSSLPVTKIHGKDRDQACSDWFRNGGVAVTTYETTAFLYPPEEWKFEMLTVDEAHYIKNPEAQRTANVKRLCSHARRLLFMTGTALENNVDEMVSLIRILKPEAADAVEGMEFLSSAPKFRELVSSVYYRRKREDVLTELPDLLDQQEWCTLSGEETKAYNLSILSKNYPMIRRVSWEMEDPEKSCKAVRMRELCDEALSDGRKVLVFSFFLDTLEKVKRTLGSRCYGPINGSVPPAKRQEIIDRFSEAPAGAVLAAQIQSGGTGLNIQCASVVILCEPQFKPSVENQAISRAYRMGQTRNVLVYRLLADDTVDERILEILSDKQEIFDAFADISEAAELEKQIDETTFGQIVEEEIERIRKENQEISGQEEL